MIERFGKNLRETHFLKIMLSFRSKTYQKVNFFNVFVTIFQKRVDIVGKSCPVAAKYIGLAPENCNSFHRNKFTSFLQPFFNLFEMWMSSRFWKTIYSHKLLELTIKKHWNKRSNYSKKNREQHLCGKSMIMFFRSFTTFPSQFSFKNPQEDRFWTSEKRMYKKLHFCRN